MKKQVGALLHEIKFSNSNAPMNNKYKILLVEDDYNIRSLVSTMLETNGYRVLRADSYMSAQLMFDSHLPDLVLLDLGLPDADGIKLVKHIRKDSLTPIIVVSARTAENDKVQALDFGANDYVTKPFGSAELLARVRASLRSNCHSAKEGKLGSKFVLNDLAIDYGARRIFVGQDEIKLTQTEFNILAYLSEHCGRVLTYQTIIKAIWGENADDGSIKKLQVNMANIRKKLGIKPGDAKYVFNELGVGYRMDS